MNIVPLAPTDTLGTPSNQYAAVYGLALYINGSAAAKANQKLDDFGTPDDTTDLDATTGRHGLMPKADKIKLDAIETGATADQSDAEIETAYNTRVARVSALEIATPTGTGVRRFAPKDMADIADVRILAAATGLDGGAAVAAIDAATADTDTIAQVLGSGTLTYNVRAKSIGLSANQSALASDSGGLYAVLGTSSNTACAGNDARLLTTDERAAISNADAPTPGNPFQTLTGAQGIKLDDFGTPDDTTDLDATTGRHGLMPKADKIKLDAIETGATADQSDAEIETAYNTRVARVSSGEIATPTGTGVRRFAPKDVADIALTQLPTSPEPGEISGAAGATARTFTPTNIADIADVRILAGLGGIGGRVILLHRIAGNGGTATGGVWETRPINFELLDTHNICSLSANQFTLAAGEYDIDAWSTGFKVDGFAARIFNATTASEIPLVTAPSIMPNSSTLISQPRARIAGRFTLAASSILRMEQYSSTTQATSGFGAAITVSGVQNVYAYISLTKLN